MAWIELHQSLWTHRKTLLLADLLDIDETYAGAHLARLWTWALDSSTDGTLPASARIIASAAGWRGDRDAFYDALIEAGWVEMDGNQCRIHNWERYMGKLMDSREKNAERARTSRIRKAHAARTAPVPYGERDAVGAPLPYPTVPNRTEQNQTEPPPTVDAVASDAPEPPAGSEPEPVARIARPKRRDLTVAAIAELQAEMPGVDMDAAAADYLNWSGSAKHVDKVQGLRNQLREEWRRKKFARSAVPGEYGIVRASPGDPPGDPPYEPPDDGQALHRGRVWRAVLQRLGNLDPPLSGQFQHALRGSAWAGQEGNVAIIVTRSAAGAEHLADMAGILAAELRAADPGTVFEDVEVRMPARGGVA